jgi:thiamine biosynthesis lipoprotein
MLLGIAGVPRTTAAPSAVTRDYRYLMGTSVEVEAYGGDEQSRRTAIDEAFGAFAEIDRLMSNYRDDSELSLINRGASREAVRVSDPMLSVLQAAQRVSVQSLGAFDVTVGPIVRLWGFHDKRPHAPTATELAAVRPLVDYRNLLLDSRQHTVRFARAGVELDLGGIAKGFAVEVAANILRKRGLTGFIDAGGNQFLLGTPPGKEAWTAGIKNPEHPDHLLGVIETAETSISTSANDANFVQIDGRRYGHIIDPHTLCPSDAALSVTILSRDGTLADAMSKAVFVLGPSEGLKLVDSIPGMSAVVAYRLKDGSTRLAISKQLGKSFRPTDATLALDRL